MTVHSITDPREVIEVITGALEEAVASGAPNLVLEVSDGIRIGREAGDVLEEGLRSAPTIDSLEFRSVSPAVHFFASTIALRLPTVRVEVTKPSGNKPAAPKKPRLVVSEQAAVRSNEKLETELERIFDRVLMRAGTHLEIQFPAEEPLPIGVANKLETHLSRTRLRGLRLVHPSVVTGFVVSTLRLRFPRMEIESSER